MNVCAAWSIVTILAVCFVVGAFALTAFRYRCQLQHERFMVTYYRKLADSRAGQIEIYAHRLDQITRNWKDAADDHRT